MFQLTEDLIFPDPFYAEQDGLLAVGGNLSPERLLLAYENGIFPWYNPGEQILWYAPNPRFVLFPQKLKVNKSMRQWMRNTDFLVTYNQGFEAVIKACSEIKRNNQLGTWIGEDMKNAYIELYKMGYAKSVEVWMNDELVGGLYGVELNGCFFGESMFHKVANASKLALITLCQENDYSVIDCQIHTQHLENMGAEMIDLEDFLQIIQKGEK